MISKATISKLIDDVQSEFEKCWQVLGLMKDGPLSALSPDEFFDFQPTLASALFHLNEMYRSLSQERRRIIARRSWLSPAWLRHRLKIVANYQKAVMEVIGIGKALGDSFAWAFYRNERRHLDKHYKHEKITHMPPGIGGRGELEFIKSARGIGGLFVLYHGITTFLRLGDISLIDLETLTVTAIGDLKTKRGGPNRLRISLYLAGPYAPGRFPLDTSHTSAKPFEQKLPPNMEAKLRRQLKKMGDSFGIAEPDRNLEFHDPTEMDALNKVAVGLKQADVVYEKAGDGLMLVGMKSWRKNSLSSKLLGHTLPDLDKRLGDINTQVKRLFDMDQVNTPMNANSIFIGHLSTMTHIGTVPLFWWPVETEFLRQLLFQEVLVVTLYNPEHFIRKLTALGYRIELLGDGRRRKVAKVIGNARIEIFGMDYFERLIKEHLVSEETIVALLSDMLQKAEAGELPANSKITLAVHRHFGNRRRRRTRSN